MSTPTVWVWTQGNASLGINVFEFMEVSTLKYYNNVSYAIEIDIKHLKIKNILCNNGCIWSNLGPYV